MKLCRQGLPRIPFLVFVFVGVMFGLAGPADAQTRANITSINVTGPNASGLVGLRQEIRFEAMLDADVRIAGGTLPFRIGGVTKEALFDSMPRPRLAVFTYETKQRDNGNVTVPAFQSRYMPRPTSVVPGGAISTLPGSSPGSPPPPPPNGANLSVGPIQGPMNAHVLTFRRPTLSPNLIVDTIPPAIVDITLISPAGPGVVAYGTDMDFRITVSEPVIPGNNVTPASACSPANTGPDCVLIFTAGHARCIDCNTTTASTTFTFRHRLQKSFSPRYGVTGYAIVSGIFFPATDKAGTGAHMQLTGSLHPPLYMQRVLDNIAPDKPLVDVDPASTSMTTIGISWSTPMKDLPRPPSCNCDSTVNFLAEYRVIGSSAWLSDPGGWQLAGSQLAWQLRNLTPDTTYEIRLAVKDDIGNTDHSATVAATTLSVPRQPKGFTADDSTDANTGIRLRWSNDIDAATYEIARKGPNDAHYTQIAVVSGLSYTDTPQPYLRGRYEYRLYPVSNGGAIGTYATADAIFDDTPPTIHSPVGASVGVPIRYTSQVLSTSGCRGSGCTPSNTGYLYDNDLTTAYVSGAGQRGTQDNIGLQVDLGAEFLVQSVKVAGFIDPVYAAANYAAATQVDIDSLNGRIVQYQTVSGSWSTVTQMNPVSALTPSTPSTSAFFNSPVAARSWRISLPLTLPHAYVTFLALSEFVLYTGHPTYVGAPNSDIDVLPNYVEDESTVSSAGIGFATKYAPNGGSLSFGRNANPGSAGQWIVRANRSGMYIVEMTVTNEVGLSSRETFYLSIQ